MEKSSLNKEYAVKPKIWSARAIDFAPKGKALSMNNVHFKLYKPKAGDYIVKSRKGGNHVDELIGQLPNGKWLAIGGNVGDMVTTREVSLMSYTHITPTR